MFLSPDNLRHAAAGRHLNGCQQDLDMESVSSLSTPRKPSLNLGACRVGTVADCSSPSYFSGDYLPWNPILSHAPRFSADRHRSVGLAAALAASSSKWMVDCASPTGCSVIPASPSSLAGSSLARSPRDKEQRPARGLMIDINEPPPNSHDTPPNAPELPFSPATPQLPLPDSAKPSRKRSLFKAGDAKAAPSPGWFMLCNEGSQQKKPKADKGGEAVEEGEEALSSSIGSADAKRCVHCGTTKTPLWRNGPPGPKSLCNACGIRFNKILTGKRKASPKEAEMMREYEQLNPSYAKPNASPPARVGPGATAEKPVAKRASVLPCAAVHKARSKMLRIHCGSSSSADRCAERRCQCLCKAEQEPDPKLQRGGEANFGDGLLDGRNVASAMRRTGGLCEGSGDGDKSSPGASDGDKLSPGASEGSRLSGGSCVSLGGGECWPAAGPFREVPATGCEETEGEKVGDGMDKRGDMAGAADGHGLGTECLNEGVVRQGDFNGGLGEGEVDGLVGLDGDVELGVRLLVSLHAGWDS